MPFQDLGARSSKVETPFEEEPAAFEETKRPFKIWAPDLKRSNSLPKI